MKETTQKMIRKTLGALALCAGLTAIGAGASQAQTVVHSYNQGPISVSAGLFVPSGKEVRRYSSDVTFAGEASYRLQTLPDSHSSTWINGGYIGSDSNFSMVPITVSQIFRNPDSDSRFSYYYGLGVGAYITKLKDPTTDEKTKGLLGGFLTAGIDGRGPLFAEVKYHYVSRYDDRIVSGVQATIGVRL